MVTGIADAYSDSTPIVAVTGNVPSHLLGRNAFQEADIVTIVAPVQKDAIQIRNVADIPAVVREFICWTSVMSPSSWVHSTCWRNSG